MKSLKYPKDIRSILKKKTQKKSLQIYGHSNEILFGLLYIIKQFPKKICLPISNSKRIHQQTPDFALKWECKQKQKQHKINFPVNKTDFIKTLKQCKKQFIAIPLYIFFKCGSSEGHANGIIFDNVNNTVERFEPYGKSLYNTFESKDIRILQNFDKAFAKFIKSSKLITFITIS